MQKEIFKNCKHEQMNAKSKGVRGGIFWQKNKSYLERWWIWISEIAHMDEFKETLKITSNEVQEHSQLFQHSQVFKTI